VSASFVGFFKGARYAAPDDQPPVRDALTEEAARLIAAYLRSGHLVAVSPMRSRDIFDEKTKLESLKYLTDGRWVWPSDLIHYVEHHRVLLPQEFEERALKTGKVPDLILDLDLEPIREALGKRPVATDRK
jgi:hypothetical protein